jgi:hypothetical protein
MWSRLRKQNAGIPKFPSFSNGLSSIGLEMLKICQSYRSDFQHDTNPAVAVPANQKFS